MLNKEIDVDHVNRLGRTALLEAIILGDGGPRHREIVRLLIHAGASVWENNPAAVGSHSALHLSFIFGGASWRAREAVPRRSLKAAGGCNSRVLKTLITV